jgi:hypothetical protein
MLTYNWLSSVFLASRIDALVNTLKVAKLNLTLFVKSNIGQYTHADIYILLFSGHLNFKKYFPYNKD